MITIFESDMDLILGNRETGQGIRLHTPTWRELINSLREFDNIATTGDRPSLPIVGTYDYNSWFREHVLTFFPCRATPDGWVACHVGTAYTHYVDVREDGAGNVAIIRDDLEQWVATDLPRPGEFFEELQALSNPDIPIVEWSSDDLNGGEIVAVVDPEGANGMEVVLYPDSWGGAMWRFVTGLEDS